VDTFLENAIYSKEGEEAVIGSILIEGELIEDCLLESNQFYFSHNKIIFKAMRDTQEKGVPVDLVTVAEELKNVGQLESIGVSYLTDLANSVPNTDNFKHYEKMVLEHWKIREGAKKANELKEKLVAEKDFGQAQAILQDIEDIRSKGSRKKFNLAEALGRVYDQMEQVRGPLTGVDTGFTELNRLTSGWQRQNLVIVAARPSMGKTAFALNIANHGGQIRKDEKTGELKEGAVISIHSLETPEGDLLRRMMCAEGNIDANRMRNPMESFESMDWSKATIAMAKINELDLFINDDPVQSVADIYRDVKELRRDFPERDIVVIIDYLQLIKGNGRNKNNRQQEIADISRGLKQLARSLDCTVIALSQLSRAVESRQDKRPMMSDLRESGQIEQDADIVAFLYRDEYYQKDSEAKGITEVILGKQRNGPIGTVELAFVKEYNKFVTLERRHGDG